MSIKLSSLPKGVPVKIWPSLRMKVRNLEEKEEEEEEEEEEMLD